MSPCRRALSPPATNPERTGTVRNDYSYKATW